MPRRSLLASLVLAFPAFPAVVACARSESPAPTAASTPSSSTSSYPLAAPPSLIDASVDATSAASIDASPPKPLLASTSQLTWIRAEARAGSPKIGYLRAGAIVERDEKPSSEDGCPHGWFGIRPRGFICVGETATLDLDDPIVKAAAPRRPKLGAPLPYAYAIAKNAMAPFYARIPTIDEARKLEYDLDDHLAYLHRVATSIAAGADAGPPEYDAGVFTEGPPSFLAGGATVPNVSNLIHATKALWAGRPRTKEGFAIVASFTTGPGGAPPSGGADDRRFDLTTDYLLVPHDRMKEVRPSTFHGVALGGSGDEGGEGKMQLPIAFTRTHRHVSTIRLDGQNGSGPLPPRTPVPLKHEVRRVSGVDYFATADGAFVRAEDVIRIDVQKSMPGFAKKGEKWIDVSIAHQSLVAYEGETPVYATLVSTGRDGLGDPESTKATIRGVYRIGQKHVTVTMDSSEVGEEFSLRDVPYVQYFTDGYALHGAYWHDDFGIPRSHGCINLAEIDAAWLFAWTGPDLPEGWHGVMAKPLATGTQIWIHV